MLGILAIIAFVIAYVFRGAGFTTSSWLGPQAMLCAGLALLAAHIVLSPDVPRLRVRREPPQ